VQAAHQRRRIGREVEQHGALVEAVGQPVFAERHRFELGRSRQGGEHHLACLGNGLWGRCPLGAGGEVGTGVLTLQVVHDELVARLLQIGCHASTHDAETDEPYLHDRFLLTRMRDPWSVCALERLAQGLDADGPRFTCIAHSGAARWGPCVALPPAF